MRVLILFCSHVSDRLRGDEITDDRIEEALQTAADKVSGEKKKAKRKRDGSSTPKKSAKRQKKDAKFGFGPRKNKVNNFKADEKENNKKKRFVGQKYRKQKSTPRPGKSKRKSK